MLVSDEAYGDFADQPHRMELLKSEKGQQIVVTRTLSKSYSLAGLRFGFAIAHPDVIRGIRKVKDSYNCDALSLAAAEAALKDQAWMLANRARIIATRTHLTRELRALGFDAVDSQTNFVWATRPQRGHQALYEQLKQRKVLVRYMKFQDETQPGCILDGLRITIGTDAEVATLLSHLREIVTAN
jgi:histidinol-phosphate aminotransferase